MCELGREDRVCWVDLVEMFCDRPRAPGGGVAVVETGNEVRGGEEKQFGSCRLVVDGGGLATRRRTR